MRPGGQWHVEQHDPAGRVFKFHGEFLELDPPARLVQTFAFADYPPGVTTIVFEDIGGKTRLTSTMRFPTLAMRDGMVHSGMERGAQQSYERLDTLLAVLQEAASSGR